MGHHRAGASGGGARLQVVVMEVHARAAMARQRWWQPSADLMTTVAGGSGSDDAPIWAWRAYPSWGLPFLIFFLVNGDKHKTASINPRLIEASA